MNPKIQSAIFKLGLYQIIGGTAGIITVFYSLLANQQNTWIILLVYAISFVFFVYSIFCGILCIKSSTKALFYSVINQFLQLIGFALLGYGLHYVAGIYVTIGIDLTKSIEASFGLGISKFDLTFRSEYEKIIINFNLVAFGLIHWICKVQKEIKK